MRAVDGHANAPMARAITHTLRYAENTDITTTAARM